MARKVNLSVKLVRSIQPTERTELYWDDKTPGLGLRVTRTGAKAYVAQYKVGGKTERATIGKPSENTLDEMREEVARRRAQARRGTTNEAERITVGELYKLWMANKVEIDCKPRTVKGYQARWRTHLAKRFGHMMASKVRAADVTALRTSMKDQPQTFNLAADVLRAIFNWASDHEYLPDGTTNPVRKSHAFPTKSRDTALTREQIADVLRAVAELEDQPRGISRQAAGAIRAIMLTGARLREVLHAQWAWLDREAKALNLPDSKTGAKVVPLAGAAFDVIEALPRVPGNPYIFAGQQPGKPLYDLTTPWERVCKRAGLVAGRQGVTVHDMRHSYATLAASAGVPLSSIGKVLGHSVEAMTARYVNTHADEAQAAAEQVADQYAEIIEQSPNVIPLRKAG